MADKFTLDANGEPVAEPNLMKWARWFGDIHARKVAREQIGPSRVSTVFLGLDHSFDEGEPILWETLVFEGPLEGEMDRCAGSREQALAMHAKMVERVKASISPAK